jgi:uncharacterized protein (UPF0335 family)
MGKYILEIVGGVVLMLMLGYFVENPEIENPSENVSENVSYAQDASTLIFQWQKITKDEAEKIVLGALPDFVPKNPRTEREDGTIEVEVDLYYNDVRVTGAEAKYSATGVQDRYYGERFMAELTELLPKAKIRGIQWDAKDGVWEVYIYLVPHIEVGEINVNGSTGKIIPD